MGGFIHASSIKIWRNCQENHECSSDQDQQDGEQADYDDEKLVISTINPAYSAIVMNSGQYIFTDLVKLLAQNTTSFTKKFVPTEHPRISKFLHTRSLKYRHVMDIMTQGSKGKGKGKPIKRQKVQDGTPLCTVFLEP